MTARQTSDDRQNGDRPAPGPVPVGGAARETDPPEATAPGRESGTPNRMVPAIAAALAVVFIAGGVGVAGQMRRSSATIQQLTSANTARIAAEAKASADAKAAKDAADLAKAKADSAQAKLDAANAKANAAQAAREASEAKASASTMARRAAEKSAVTYCGNVGGYTVSANAATSCPFATTVARGYLQWGRFFSAESAVTGQWYEMACTSYPVTCTGGRGAAVYLR